MNIDCHWLEEHFFKQRFTDEQKQLVTEKIEVVEYAAGSTIVAQGSMGNAVYVVHSGAAAINCDCNGESMHVGTVKAGDLVGEMSFLTDNEASATVTARDDCIIYKLTRDSFTMLMKKDPELAYAVFAHLLTHTANVIRQMNAEKAAIHHYMAGNHF
jgi:CRP/FNR family cyclic AMP-dependent transcriptional regulator